MLREIFAIGIFQKAFQKKVTIEKIKIKHLISGSYKDIKNFKKFYLLKNPFFLRVFTTI